VDWETVLSAREGRAEFIGVDKLFSKYSNSILY
jgi:hypothetical protein